MIMILTNGCTEIVSICVPSVLDIIFVSNLWNVAIAWCDHIVGCTSSILLLVGLSKDVSLGIVFQIHF